MAGSFAPEADNGKAYPRNLTVYVLVTCIIAAMGGLIFGYDIGISGNFSNMKNTHLSEKFLDGMKLFIMDFVWSTLQGE